MDQKKLLLRDIATNFAMSAANSFSFDVAIESVVKNSAGILTLQYKLWGDVPPKKHMVLHCFSLNRKY